MYKRIAVIGGAGFIGSHTVNELIKNGHNPIVIDSKPPGPLDLYWCELRDRPRPYIEYRQADITNPTEINKALKGIDVAYMLAAVSNASKVEKDPELGLKTNVSGLSNVLLACVKNKIKRVIFSSSVWVYSSAENQRVNEETLIPTNTPSHIYTTSKIVGENLIRSFHEMYGLNYTILRYGVAYGPGANENTAISSFIKNALKGDPIVINGSGESARSFLFVEDHARGNVLALKVSAENQTFNLDGKRRISIKEVAEIVQKVCKQEINIIHKSSILSEYKGKNVSIKKAKEVLDWSPRVSFKEGIKKHYEWQSSSYSSSR
ncbi:hypothetical protein CL634_02025 [bacterium]|nr:hypothetical protein [bacterium]